METRILAEKKGQHGIYQWNQQKRVCKHQGTGTGKLWWKDRPHGGHGSCRKRYGRCALCHFEKGRGTRSVCLRGKNSRLCTWRTQGWERSARSRCCLWGGKGAIWKGTSTDWSDRFIWAFCCNAVACQQMETEYFTGSKIKLPSTVP